MKRKESEDYPIQVQDLVTEELKKDLSITRDLFLYFGNERSRAIAEKIDTLLGDEKKRKKAEQQEQDREELVTLLNMASLVCLATWRGGNRIAERMKELMDDEMFTFFYELADTVRVQEIARRSAKS